MRTDKGQYACSSCELAIATGDGEELVPAQKVEIVDITEDVKAAVAASGVLHGSCVLLAKHTTVALTLNESEARLERDFATWLFKIAPKDGTYEHNDLDKRPERASDLAAIERNWVSKGLGTVAEFMAQEPVNAHAHLMASCLGSSLALPVSSGALSIGQWQSILLVDCDAPRRRTVAVTVHGVGTGT